MERRRFLQAATLTGGAAVAAGPGCARPSLLASLLPEGRFDAEVFLARLEAQLERIGAGNPLASLGGAGRHAPDCPVSRRRAELARKGLRSLLLAGSFADLTEAQRVHPAVQARVKKGVPELDEAVFGMRDALAGLPAAELRAAAARLRDEPRLADEVLESLDALARDNGIAVERRRQMRAVATNLTWRLSHEPIETVIAEAVERVDRVAATHRTDAEAERRLAARMGAQRFEAFRARQLELAALWRERLGSEGSAGDDGGPKTPREQVSSAGSCAMGIGAVIAAASLLVMLVGEEGVILGMFGLTPAAVLLLAGIIVWVVASRIPADCACGGERVQIVRPPPRAAAPDRLQRVPEARPPAPTEPAAPTAPGTAEEPVTMEPVPETEEAPPPAP